MAVADILEVNNENQGENEPPAEKKFSSATRVGNVLCVSNNAVYGFLVMYCPNFNLDAFIKVPPLCCTNGSL